MDISLQKSTPNQGFTLIEVLIALVILSIALTAITHSTTQMIRNTRYLQNKTIALWVGTQVINEITLDLITIPESSHSLENSTIMLGKKWQWRAELFSTPNPKIKKIILNVSLPPDKNSYIHLTSYLYAKK